MTLSLSFSFKCIEWVEGFTVGALYRSYLGVSGVCVFNDDGNEVGVIKLKYK